MQLVLVKMNHEVLCRFQNISLQTKILFYLRTSAHFFYHCYFIILGDNVDCWMEIQHGKGPWAPPVSGIVPLGSTLTLVVAINDYRGKEKFAKFFASQKKINETVFFLS